MKIWTKLPDTASKSFKYLHIQVTKTMQWKYSSGVILGQLTFVIVFMNHDHHMRLTFIIVSHLNYSNWSFDQLLNLCVFIDCQIQNIWIRPTSNINYVLYFNSFQVFSILILNLSNKATYLGKSMRFFSWIQGSFMGSRFFFRFSVLSRFPVLFLRFLKNLAGTRAPRISASFRNRNREEPRILGS